MQAQYSFMLRIELKALAYIDQVYHKRREGLIDNIGFLYKMM
jgi:hypothetical protein